MTTEGQKLPYHDRGTPHIPNPDKPVPLLRQSGMWEVVRLRGRQRRPRSLSCTLWGVPFEVNMISNRPPGSIVRHRKTILVLGSGTGGVAKAFEVHPHWKIVRIDNNPRFLSVPHTRTLDILDWMDWIDEIGPVELLWASPECTQFSLARGVMIEEPDLTVVKAIRDIIDYLKPRWYIVENVRGACPHFQPFFGQHRQRLGPFFLWGTFPWLDVHVTYKGQTKHRINRDLVVSGDGGWWEFNGVRYNKWDTPQNAAIPIEISEALLKGCETFVSLEEWCA